jgi:hypothetical protein
MAGFERGERWILDSAARLHKGAPAGKPAANANRVGARHVAVDRYALLTTGWVIGR